MTEEVGEVDMDFVLADVPAGLPKTTHLYSLYVNKDENSGSGGDIKITKYLQNWDFSSSYWMLVKRGGYDCKCPAGTNDCRHKAIVQFAKHMNALGHYEIGVMFDGKSKACKLIKLPDFILEMSDIENASTMVDLSNV